MLWASGLKLAHSLEVTVFINHGSKRTTDAMSVSWLTILITAAIVSSALQVLHKVSSYYCISQCLPVIDFASVQ
jgi:hypothetical protein